jgi:hypothetical protein
MEAEGLEIQETRYDKSSDCLVSIRVQWDLTTCNMVFGPEDGGIWYLSMDLQSTAIKMTTIYASAGGRNSNLM